MYHIIGEMTRDDEMTLIHPTSNTVFRVVGYENSSLRNELATANTGSAVNVRLKRVGSEAKEYVAHRASEPLSITRNPPRNMEERMRAADASTFASGNPAVGSEKQEQADPRIA